MILLDVDAIEHISYGAAILGSGGGGDPHLGKILAQQAIKQHGQIRLISADELQPNDLLLATGMIGAPTIMLEKISNSNQSVEACRHVEKYLERSATAIYPIEAGGINSLLPLATACYSDLPVVDMDSMGRAFPELHMTTFYLDDIQTLPYVLVDEKLNKVMIDTTDMREAETIARAVTATMGGSTMFAGYPLSAAQAQQSGIPGTISLMKRIGERMQQAVTNKDDLVATLTSLLKGHVLFRGKLNRLSQCSDGGFTHGYANFISLDNKKTNFSVLFQNEYLLVQENHTPLCISPDLIILVDEDTGQPLLTERLSYGMNVVAIGAPVHEKWRTPRGIEICGPAHFKYPVDYVPVETLVEAYRKTLK